MYQKKSEQLQMTLEDFVLPFGGKLSAKNRWVRLAQLLPWEMIEDIYAKNFKNEKPDGRPAIPARIAFGALHIQASECFTDEKTLENICENPYLQYLLGLHSFQVAPPFDTSMTTLFRKLFAAEDVAAINEELYRRTHPPKDDEPPQDNANSGTLVLDATAAPADVRYPTDLSLLNECRENVEKLIDEIWDSTARCGHKTSYNRKKARAKYLKVAKQRKPRKNAIRQAIVDNWTTSSAALPTSMRCLRPAKKILCQIARKAVWRSFIWWQRSSGSMRSIPQNRFRTESSTCVNLMCAQSFGGRQGIQWSSGRSWPFRW